MSIDIRFTQTITMPKIFTRQAMAATLTGFLLLFVDAPAIAEILLGADGGQGNPSQLYELDPADGSVTTTIGPIGFAVTGLAVHPQTNAIYGSTSNREASIPGHLISIDLQTGAGADIGQLIDGTQTAADLTFAVDGTLYGWIEPGDQLATIDLTTGAATLVGPSGLNTFGSGIAMSSASDLYLTGGGDDGTLNIINTTTGMTDSLIALVGGSGLSQPINALSFDAGGTLFGSRGTNCFPCLSADLLAIDTTTGNITVLGQSVNKLDAIVFHPLIRANVALVRPRSNEVKVGRRSPLTVVILGSDTFDVSTVDGSTITFGTGAATLTHYRGPHTKDFNNDGRPDLLAHFRTSDTGINCGDIGATLSAQNLTGDPITGTTAIVTVGRNC